MKITLRPTKRYWLLKVVIPLLCVLVVSIGASGLLSVNSESDLWARCLLVLMGISLVLGILFVRNGVLLAFRYVLHMDENGMRGRDGGKEQFEVLWSEVVAAWVSNIGTDRQPHLLLGTHNGVLVVNLVPFDEDRVWAAVQSYADSETLREESLKRMLAHEDWETSYEELKGELVVRPLRVTDRMNAVTGWVGLIFSAVIVVLAFFQGKLIIAFLFVPLLVLGTTKVLFSGAVEMDAEAVTRTNRLGRYRMEWEEIEWVETTVRGTPMVFRGDAKQLVIPGPRLWTGTDREEIGEWLQMQLAEYQIEVRRLAWVDFKWSRNTRQD